MRRNSTTPRWVRLAQAMATTVAEEGCPTIVNGRQPALLADWAEAQPSRIQRFIEENAWGQPVYEVYFAGATVLQAPYNLKNGSAVARTLAGLTESGVVRHFEPDDSTGQILGIWALVEMIPA